ncbi:hypothetical protein MTO96_007152 [Rhipicephalus appendiculatus]|uniref:Serpin B n=1 Tax=Rhipicephalus appendiculatus TaxID=34631 RepID=A0A131Z4D5_RHIAP
MMYEENDYKMSRSDELGVTALEIMYEGGRTSMVVLLPDDVEGLSKLEDTLTGEKIAKLLKDLRERSEVRLYLPKFKLEQAINLKQTLSAMGIEDLFAHAADLSGVSAKENLLVSEVFHKAFVEVSEEGTEAAAAAAVVAVAMCARDTEEFVVDRPFMFLIRSREPELILFLGSVRQL